MVECIDTAVGRVMDQLEEDGELDNTVGIRTGFECQDGMLTMGPSLLCS